jgi:anthranilate phosphoribosyltransferase
MKQLGAEHVMVVHSKDGLDEISLAASTYVAELKMVKLRMDNYT